MPEDLNFRQAFLTAGVGDAKILTALLKPIMHRLRFFAISSLMQLDQAGFRDLLDCPAPVLEEAKLASGFGNGDRPASELPSGLFAGTSKLHTLELRYIQLPPLGSTCPALSTVRSFTWEQMFSLDIDTMLFCHLLALMPRLEVLRLSVRDFIWSGMDVEMPGSCCLRSFTLWFEHEASGLVRCLRNVKTITHFYCSSARPTVTGALLDSLGEDEVTAYVGPVTSELVVLPAAFARPLSIRGNVINLFGASTLGWNASFQPSPLGASRITTLSLHEFYWPQSFVVPPFPRLRWLRVALASCFAYRMSPDGYFDSILADIELSTWDAPMLETVVIAYVMPKGNCQNAYAFLEDGVESILASCFCTRPTLAVCLSDVHRFLTTYVLRPGDRLSNLFLQGIEPVDHDPWGSLGQLQSIAGDVSITAVSEPMNCDLDSVVIPEPEEGELH
ncbi:hypothetical protein AURDEDRAFT_162039 [Auricularia subglabra TFB-10046 SS5]|nr:hypothetical protein AURDEDRAFT_162039 [Auricularia subglabra TFB-10046 SS5]